jgi:tetratricopeptide (TPR) repeat protein
VLVAVDALIALGHPDEAEAALGGLPSEQVRNISLFAELAAQRGDTEVALARLAGSTGASARALRGWLFVGAGRFADAVRELRAASQAVPVPSTLINLGYAYAALGSRGKAIRATEVAAGLSGGGLGAIASLNLVAYFVAGGDMDQALSVLDRFEHRHPHDLRVSLARASVLGRRGDSQGSLRELRRARSSQAYWVAGADKRAEIEAEIACTELRAGRRTRESALKALHEQLMKTSHRSLGVANLMSMLTWKKSDARLFGAVYEALCRVHVAEDMLNLQAHLCMLRGDYERSAELSAKWAERCPLDESAVVKAVYLLTDGSHNFARAVELGLDGLRRFPGSALLANDVAYAFAMAGDLQRARKHLPRRDALPVIRATRGLISFLAGQPEEGLRMYDEAAEMASSVGDTRTAKAALYHKELLLAVVSGADAAPVPPRGYEDDVHFDLERRAVEQARPQLTKPQLPLFGA